MKTTKTAAAILAVAFLGTGLAFAGEKGAGPADGKAKALFESKCAMCHPLSRSLERKKDRDGWTATVTRMRKTNGCPLTDDEAKTIVDHLVEVSGPAAAK